MISCCGTLPKSAQKFDNLSHLCSSFPPHQLEPLSVHRGLGLVSQVFNEPIMMTLKGNLGIGHTRYSTMGGGDNVGLAQPFIVHTAYGTIAVAHNGELVNSNRLRERILANGVGLSTGSDSELITQALSMEPPDSFKQDYINKRFNKGNNGAAAGGGGEGSGGAVNGHRDGGVRDIEDHNFNQSSPYATQLSQKEASFVARILHVSDFLGSGA